MFEWAQQNTDTIIFYCIAGLMAWFGIMMFKTDFVDKSIASDKWIQSKLAKIGDIEIRNQTKDFILNHTGPGGLPLRKLDFRNCLISAKHKIAAERQHSSIKSG